MIGKVPPEQLTELILDNTGAPDDTVIMGPHYGEDASAIELDAPTTLVISTDPISLAVKRIGTLGVYVASNDIAASGATPQWLTNSMFLPTDDDSLIKEITTQLHTACKNIPMSIVGGHSEYLPALDRPLLCLTCLGTTDNFIPTGGANPQDNIILTKGAGVEGTAILATDFKDRLTDTVPHDVITDAREFFDRLSIIPEAHALRPYATAMHDPTEGGIIDGLIEVAHASNTQLTIDTEAIPIDPITEQLCTAANVDPLRIFGSGSLIATIPPDHTSAAKKALVEHNIPHSVIGTVTEAGESGINLDGSFITNPGRDDLYNLWE